MRPRDDVLIVGGGAIGLACGLALVEAGRRVRVLEAGTAGCGSSHGNCGTITPSHAGPLAAPGTIARALRWLFAGDAPLRIAPRFDPALWAWLAGFALRCNRRDWRHAMRARASILQASRAAFPGWLADHGIDCEFAATGIDYVYRDRAQFDAFEAEGRALRELGIELSQIDGARALREEPALREGTAGVVRFPGDARLRPDRYVAGLATAFRAAGGVLEEHCEVLSAGETADGVRVTTARGGFAGRDLLLAAGAWSPGVARGLGLRVPVQPGKGYSMTYARPPSAPARSIVLHERSVFVTVWEAGLRLGGTMEFAGHDRSLNRVRIDAIERAAGEYLHLPAAPHREDTWTGLRPVCVDDLPLIGPAPGHRHVWLATGHGMLGISMSVATAHLIRDLIRGTPPGFDPAPFTPARFA
ncbi:FAD-dependent oxidoreductase [Luteimonas sp. FCS-9]|uniref:NAD(P)/FAD-dependent oxidoreductase n=1 Tax=Luteimonas sp. FCS-9 TaxID=1547516 RepID=UPI00063ECAEB|nr:FAD-dependent oxidoreductase [Luteimonas sp. FCS-9]KLJ00408.1 amino acid dehydrogenase [Luteimonas sp. FCS-9]